MSDITDFNDLLNAAELLAADTDGSSDLPKWNRTVHQLAEAAEEMWTRIGSKASGQENQANALLAPKGVDIPQMTQKLESLSTRKTFQPLDPVGDIDVKSYLRNEYENGILAVIALTQKLSAQSVKKSTWSHTKLMWEREKSRITNAMLGSKKTYLDLPLEAEESSFHDIPSVKSMLNQQEVAYARAVTEYNKSVMDGLVQPNLVHSFYAVAKEFNDKKVLDMWEMVKFMVDIPQQPVGDILLARATPAAQNALIIQAKKYLEERYRTYMSSVVQGNLQKAMRGGVPGTYPLVRSFVGVRVAPAVLGLEDGLIDGQPVWPLIYYCLRCGDVNAALHVARQAESSLSEFSSVLEQLARTPDGRLSSKVEGMVKAQYRRYTRNTTDPFKRAVYCVVGACDVNDEHQEVAQTADDYLWFKLSQIRHEDNAETKGERMTYAHLQSIILEEFGESHYKANEQPHIYFQMLILTGQFEAAVEFLFRMPKLKVHGVHVGIALHELGLLADPPSVLASLLTVKDEDKPPARRLNFVRLVSLYVRSFQASDPREAIQYFYFLRNMENHVGENMLTLCVAELVQESREVDLILGKLEPDGCRIPGLIDGLKGLKQTPTDIIRYVARDCEAKGNLEDAIQLFDLANECDKVLSIMNTLLTQVVSQVSKPGSLRARLQSMAQSISARYEGSDLKASAETSSTFTILRDLLIFFDQYHAGQHSQALETITRSKLLPMTKEEIPERVSNFKRLHDQVKRHFADILIVTMIILQTQYNKTHGDSSVTPRFEDSSREKQQQLAYIRDKARVLTNFAGSLPYRLKGDTNTRLVHMEITMN